MSTQHPDNVDPPFFADTAELGGEDEIEEAYYAFSHLDCDEQMWDAEGKEVDDFVVKKLLGKYERYFGERLLGRDLFLTLRVPNPAVETTEAKTLLEALESIPRSYDATRPFYDADVPPIFEVILPMAASALDLERVYRYYRDIVVGKQTIRLGDGDVTVGEWVGVFKPDRIAVIPLYEDMDHMLAAGETTKEYLRGKELEQQRVFLARSDPAMNYGLIGAVLLNKIALLRLHRVSSEIGVRIYPIVGVGSVPFRGGLTPRTVDRVLAEYPSVHTFTVQSAFKYDYEPREVRDAVHRLREHQATPPPDVDEERCLDIILRTARAYAEHVTRLAPLVQRLATHVPARRKRKLHVGLFGYARTVGAAKLPRAITFTSALYSLGLPPELLGLEVLSADDREFLRGVYRHLDDDIRDAARYLNPKTGLVPREITDALARFGLETPADEEHQVITGEIAELLASGHEANVGRLVVRAAGLRRFLG